MKQKYLTDVELLDRLEPESKGMVARVAEKYRFKAHEYYLSLIDWDNPADPIRRLIVPDENELDSWGDLDPSGEKNYTIVPGLEHKYSSTALLLVSNHCGGICRYCFRKRVFINNKEDEILSDIPAAVDYLKEHTEITNVLLTGGDPLAISTAKLNKIVDELLKIDHIQIIRFGTRMLAFNPDRILDDPSVSQMIRNCNNAGKQVYVMNHFIHANELTEKSTSAIRMIQKAGAVLTNQCPMIRGINDNPDALAELFRQLSFLGVPPYYVFQCRPAKGNRFYAVPIEEGYRIFELAKTQVSGLAKRARFVMSHASGKIEIVGMTSKHIYMKYHRAARDADSGAFMSLERNPMAYWLDDYGSAFIKDRPVASA